jgi:hypothetical protein
LYQFGTNRKARIMNFSFGSDPEFMIVKDGKYHSAIEIVPGDKYKRHKIGKHQYFYDNVMAECAVAPGRSKNEVIKNFRDCFKKYAKLVAPYRLVVKASQNYPVSELQHPEAKKIGCDPEVCIYRLEVVKPPKTEFLNHCLRTAGGHVHLGNKMLQDEATGQFVIRMLDLFLGIPSVFLDKDKSSVARRKLYGKAGRYRSPKHGIEYRSLGNFWIASPKLVGLIYDICEFTLDFVKNGKHLNFWTVDEDRLNDEKAWAEEDFTPASCYHCHGYDVDLLQEAINMSSKTKAKKFLKIIQENLPRQLFNRIQTEDAQFDFYKEWNL